MKDILLEETKNIVDTADKEKYDSATLGKPKMRIQCSLIKLLYIYEQLLSVHLMIQAFRQLD